VTSCCGSEAYGRFFGSKGARRALRRYRRRGLDRLTRLIFDVVSARAKGATVLEGGGGIGDLQVELLDAGAAGAVNVELSPEYEETARELLRERGVEPRVERRIGDFVDEDVAAADVVVLNRVVCCYPDYARLLRAAADRTRTTLVVTFPAERPLTRAVFAAMNTWLRLRRSDFRGFVHPVNEMLGVLRDRGLTPTENRRGTFWQLVAVGRP
jgi:SAM-dependent methyltransferase